jgi:hypothetical protein
VDAAARHKAQQRARRAVSAACCVRGCLFDIAALLDSGGCMLLLLWLGQLAGSTGLGDGRQRDKTGLECTSTVPGFPLNANPFMQVSFYWVSDALWW